LSVFQFFASRIQRRKLLTWGCCSLVASGLPLTAVMLRNASASAASAVTACATPQYLDVVRWPYVDVVVGQSSLPISGVAELRFEADGFVARSPISYSRGELSARLRIDQVGEHRGILVFSGMVGLPPFRRETTITRLPPTRVEATFGNGKSDPTGSLRIGSGSDACSGEVTMTYESFSNDIDARTELGVNGQRADRVASKGTLRNFKPGRNTVTMTIRGSNTNTKVFRRTFTLFSNDNDEPTVTGQVNQNGSVTVFRGGGVVPPRVESLQTQTP
jgi:hypothetical protein